MRTNKLHLFLFLLMYFCLNQIGKPLSTLSKAKLPAKVKESGE